MGLWNNGIIVHEVVGQGYWAGYNSVVFACSLYDRVSVGQVLNLNYIYDFVPHPTTLSNNLMYYDAIIPQLPWIMSYFNSGNWANFKIQTLSTVLHK